MGNRGPEWRRRERSALLALFSGCPTRRRRARQQYLVNRRAGQWGQAIVVGQGNSRRLRIAKPPKRCPTATRRTHTLQRPCRSRRWLAGNCLSGPPARLIDRPALPQLVAPARHRDNGGVQVPARGASGGRRACGIPQPRPWHRTVVIQALSGAFSAFFVRLTDCRVGIHFPQLLHQHSTGAQDQAKLNNSCSFPGILSPPKAQALLLPLTIPFLPPVPGTALLIVWISPDLLELL